MSTMEKFRPPMTGNGRKSSDVVKTMEGLQHLAEQQMKQKERNLLHIQELKQKISVLHGTQNMLTAQAQVKQRDIGCLTASRQALREHLADVDAIYKLIATSRAEADRCNAENHDILTLSQEVAHVLENVLADALKAQSSHDDAKNQLEAKIQSIERVLAERKAELGPLLEEEQRLSTLAQAAQVELASVQESVSRLSAELQQLDVSVETSRLGRESADCSKQQAAEARTKAAHALATTRHEAAAFTAQTRAAEAGDASAVSVLESELAAALEERALAVGDVEAYVAQAEEAAVAAQVEEEHAAAAAERAAAAQAALQATQSRLSSLLTSRSDAEAKLDQSTTAMLQYSELTAQARTMQAQVAQVKGQTATTAAQVEASMASRADSHRKAVVCRALLDTYPLAMKDLCSALLATEAKEGSATLQEGITKVQQFIQAFASGVPASLTSDPRTTAVVNALQGVLPSLHEWTKDAQALQNKAKDVAAAESTESMMGPLRALSSVLSSLSNPGCQYMKELGMSKNVESAVGQVAAAIESAVDKDAAQAKIIKATSTFHNAKSKQDALDAAATAAEHSAALAYARVQEDKATVTAMTTALAAFEGTLAAKTETKVQHLRSTLLAELQQWHAKIGTLHSSAVGALSEAAKAEADVQAALQAQAAAKGLPAQAGVKRGASHLKSSAPDSAAGDNKEASSDEDELASVRVSVQGSKGRGRPVEQQKQGSASASGNPREASAATIPTAAHPSKPINAPVKLPVEAADEDDEEEDIMAMMVPTARPSAAASSKAMPPPPAPAPAYPPATAGASRKAQAAVDASRAREQAKGAKAPAVAEPSKKHTPASHVPHMARPIPSRRVPDDDDALSLAGSEVSIGSSLFGDVALGRQDTGGTLSQASEISALYAGPARPVAMGPVTKAQRVSFATARPTASAGGVYVGPAGTSRHGSHVKVARGGPTGGGDEEDEDEDSMMGPGSMPPPPVPYGRPSANLSGQIGPPPSMPMPMLAQTKPPHKTVGLAGNAARPGLLASRGLGHAMFGGGVDMGSMGMGLGAGGATKSPVLTASAPTGTYTHTQHKGMQAPPAKAAQPAHIPAARPAMQPVHAAGAAGSKPATLPGPGLGAAGVSGARAGTGVPIPGLLKAKPVNMFDAW